jgi:hypothetical protein
MTAQAIESSEEAGSMDLFPEGWSVQYLVKGKSDCISLQRKERSLAQLGSNACGSSSKNRLLFPMIERKGCLQS